MENQIGIAMENEWKLWEIQGFKEFSLGYYIGESLLIIVYTHFGNFNLSLSSLPATQFGLLGYSRSGLMLGTAKLNMFEFDTVGRMWLS